MIIIIIMINDDDAVLVDEFLRRGFAIILCVSNIVDRWYVRFVARLGDARDRHTTVGIDLIVSIYQLTHNW